MAKSKKNQDEKIKPIPEGKISDIVEFGEDKNRIVIESVGSFRNLMNYSNKPRIKERYIVEKYIDDAGKEQEKQIREVEDIYYQFEDTPEFELVKAQTVKLILEGEEVDVTTNNIIKFFNRRPKVFRTVMGKIMESLKNETFQGI